MNNWSNGFPTMPGWYECLVDGEEMRLKHFICQMSMKHKWISENGDYITESVLWRKEPLPPRSVKKF